MRSKSCKSGVKRKYALLLNFHPMHDNDFHPMGVEDRLKGSGKDNQKTRLYVFILVEELYDRNYWVQ